MASKKNLYLGLDCGSSSIKGILYDPSTSTIRSTERIKIATSRHAQEQSLLIEQSPQELLDAATLVIKRLLKNTTAQETVSIGIASQRSSFLITENGSSKPLTPIISWQDTRGLALLDQLKDSKTEVYQKTGLYLTPYYTLTKLLWVLKNKPAILDLARSGKCRLHYLPTFLLAHLTQEKLPWTDATLAQRSLLLDCQKGQWDSALIKKFSIPESLLPQIKPTHHHYGTLIDSFKKPGTQIKAMLGDQQAAFLALNSGKKIPLPLLNLGTGGFILIPTGKKLKSHNGLLSGILCQKPEGLEYLLEGTVTSIQGALKWLRSIGLIDNDAPFAAPKPGEWNKIPLVTGSFGGLASPHWRGDLKIQVQQIDQTMSRQQLLQGFLLNLAHLFWEIIAPLKNSSYDPKKIIASGGLSKSPGLLEILAGYLDRPIVSIADADLTALGACQAASNFTLKIPIETGRPIKPNPKNRTERDLYRQNAHRELLTLLER